MSSVAYLRSWLEKQSFIQEYFYLVLFEERLYIWYLYSTLCVTCSRFVFVWIAQAQRGSCIGALRKKQMKIHSLQIAFTVHSFTKSQLFLQYLPLCPTLWQTGTIYSSTNQLRATRANNNLSVVCLFKQANALYRFHSGFLWCPGMMTWKRRSLSKWQCT